MCADNMIAGKKALNVTNTKALRALVILDVYSTMIVVDKIHGYSARHSILNVKQALLA